MPRDEYDDEDDRPRRRRRRDDDDYERPAAKSNTGVILLVVGLVVGIPVLGCAGLGIWGYFAAKKGFDQLQTMVGAEMAAESFLNTLEGGNIQHAYDMTSANFKSTTTKVQFEQLVKANPALTSSNYYSHSSGIPNATGTAPNRKMVLIFNVTPGDGMDEEDFDDEGEPIKPKVPKPNAKANPNAKPVNCTITVAEQADGTWKVDGLTVP